MASFFDVPRTAGPPLDHTRDAPAIRRRQVPRPASAGYTVALADGRRGGLTADIRLMTRSIHVLGAGIVGICTAVELARRGFAVTLVDRREPARETSWGNAGVIAAGS